MKRFGTFNVSLQIINDKTGAAVSKTMQDTFAYEDMTDAKEYFSSDRYLERVLSTKIPVQLRRHVRLQTSNVAHV
jgi:hypothetical protein